MLVRQLEFFPFLPFGLDVGGNRFCGPRVVVYVGTSGSRGNETVIPRVTILTTVMRWDGIVQGRWTRGEMYGSTPSDTQIDACDQKVVWSKGFRVDTKSRCFWKNIVYPFHCHLLTGKWIHVKQNNSIPPSSSRENKSFPYPYPCHHFPSSQCHAIFVVPPSIRKPPP
jgi:hypothetical protein